MQPLPLTIPDFTSASTLVVGDLMLDRYWLGDTTRISPEAPVQIVKVNHTDNRPGGAGNVGLNLVALGSKTTLLGMIGTDEAGETLKKLLAAAGVNYDICSLSDIATIIKLRVISRHQQLIRLDFEEQLIHARKEMLVERFKNHLPQANLVILSDYNKGTLSDPQTFIQLAKKAGIPVIVDPKSDDFNIYREASMITPNFKEFELIVGKCKSNQDIIKKGHELLKKYQIDALLVTRGEHGMTLIKPGEDAHFPAYAREVFDVTGAGDTVISVLGAALAAGKDLWSATALANLGASLVVAKLGAATVSAAELQAALTSKTSCTAGMVSEQQLLEGVKQARAHGKRIVFTNGCFDILHAGHVTYLQMAKQLGDYLIVAVNSDDSIKKAKGSHRPVNPLEHRMTVLAGLDAVDWVVPFDDDTPERLLRLLKPDLLVKGGDYEVDQIVGADIVRAYGGDVRIMNHTIRTSTTSLIHHLQFTSPIPIEG